ncbi:hypothetical protein C0992_001091 [Termitomyces sp. T32_za158]|nr:hypothetical protein C0992_001091 [Termitomyces sp. T32_za158]
MAQLYNQNDFPTKRFRTQSIQSSESHISVNETQNTLYEDRNSKEVRTDPPDQPYSSNIDIPLETTSQLRMPKSRRPSISQATNVTLSPEFPHLSHTAIFQRPESLVQDVQHQDAVIIAETSQETSPSSSIGLLKRQEIDPERLSPQGPASGQESEQEPILLDIGQPRSNPDSSVPLQCSPLEISEFLHRQPFPVRPFPKWTRKCENVTSFSIRRLLGGLTGPGATFTVTGTGRTHLFLQRDNCPFLPGPGEPSVVYVGCLDQASQDVRVFIRRGVQKGSTMWEYGGDYKCILKLIDPCDFKKESTRFREDFVRKFLFEKEFQSHYVDDPGPLHQSNKSTRDAELRAIDRGDKVKIQYYMREKYHLMMNVGLEDIYRLD